jgi:hypothetical protein
MNHGIIRCSDRPEPLAADERRGVDVAAILDKSQDRQDDPRGRYSPAVYPAHAGVRVLIDDEPAIAHSKVVVLDGRIVITAVSQTRADGVGALASAATCTAVNDGNSDAPAIAMTPNSASRRHLYTWLANNP